MYWLWMHLDASNGRYNLQCLELVAVAALAHIGHAQPCHQGYRLFLFIPPSFICWISSSRLSLYDCKKAGFLLFKAERRGKDKGHSPCRLGLLPLLRTYTSHVSLARTRSLVCPKTNNWPRGMRALWLALTNQNLFPRFGVRAFSPHSVESLSSTFGKWRKGGIKATGQAG